jgi:hypothetical protein
MGCTLWACISLGVSLFAGMHLKDLHLSYELNELCNCTLLNITELVVFENWFGRFSIAGLLPPTQQGQILLPLASAAATTLLQPLPFSGSFYSLATTLC